MINRLKTISHAENVRFVEHPNLATEEEKKQKEGEVLNEILMLCKGDMRRAVTTLQSAHLLSGGGSSSGGCIKKESIAEMAGLPPQSIITSLLDTLQQPASTYDTMEKGVKDIMLEGYAAQHIMKELLRKLMVLDSKVLSEVHKAQIAIKIAEADKNLVDSADETLQLLVVCSLVLNYFH
jgi:replication factor C subunit 2/4